jgi:uncharacterized membrane protein
VPIVDLPACRRRGRFDVFGVHGLDPFGLVHAGLGVASIALGLVVVLLPKGTRAHRRVGVAYTTAMLMLNGTALFIYDLWGRFGPFHWFAILSLLTLAGGLIPAWLRRPVGWLDIHARMMAWSYAGVVAASAAEIGARIPGVRFVDGVVWPTIGVTVVAGILIHSRVPALIDRLHAPRAAASAG